MTTNSFVDTCPHCGEDTCLNNVSTRPAYHTKECWSCGYDYRYMNDTGQTIEFFMTEEEMETLRADMEGEQ